MFTRELETSFNVAVRDTRRRRHEVVCLEHILMAMLKDEKAREVLIACGAEVAVVETELNDYLEGLETVPEGEEPDFDQSEAVTRVLQRAIVHAQSSGRSQISPGDFIAAMFREQDSFAVHVLEKQGMSRLDVLNYISHGISRDGLPSTETVGDGPDAERRTADPLEGFCVDLVARAKAGKIDPLIGRVEELKRTMHVLCRRRKNNPILVGEPGVGKTAIAEGFALAVAEDRVPHALLNTEIFSLEMGSVVAGTKFRGEFEQRLKGIIAAIQKRDRAILFIDEIHNIVGAGAVSGGTLDASGILKPVLASGELRCIGSTTFKEFQSTFEKDRALARRFQKIDVGEPSQEEAVEILHGLRSRYEEFHGVHYSDEALRLAVDLSARHINDRLLPDKAIDVIDEAGAEARLNRQPPVESDSPLMTTDTDASSEVAEAGESEEIPTADSGVSESASPDPEITEIGRAEVEATVSKMARIPPPTVSTSGKEMLRDLERNLKLVIFGQDSAVEALVAAIKLSRSGLGNPNHPTGSFLFSGPTGVGKTELARQMALALGVELIRFDMSEYMEPHSVARLIGAPPGYVGFDQGGLLTDAVLKKPHSVVILDEIEKAHPDVYNVLLQVMDHATLTDHTGRQVDFHNVTLIMTTNAGAHELDTLDVGFTGSDRTSDGKKAIERVFSPEFRNRLDAWISFDHLPPKVIRMVVDKFVTELELQLASKSVDLECTLAARDWLAENGHDKKNGARPMSRLIDQQIRKVLADEILFGALENGGVSTVDVVDGELKIDCSAAN